MSKITTLEQFKDYLLKRCGYPVINVEIAPEQLDLITEDTIQYYQTYNMIDGSNMEYYVFSVSAGIDTYDMSNLNIQGIVDIEISIGLDGLNTLFSPTHELLYSDFIRKGSIMGTDTPDYSPGLTLTSYDTAMYYLKEIKNKFGRGFAVQYNKNREILKVVPCPQDNMMGVLTLYRKEEAIYLYNNQLIKDLAYAKTMMLWGNILSKYTANMPDGITMNGSDIYNKGKELYDYTIEDIRKQSPPPDFMFG
jgi:hypothetical protein